MGRRAVQGYTEKSYYENTRFLGTLATTDPMSEGYFKHLVNMDISDTGQSVVPRKGFLTTNLYVDIPEQTVTTLGTTEYPIAVTDTTQPDIVNLAALYTCSIGQGAVVNIYDIDTTTRTYVNLFGQTAYVFDHTPTYTDYALANATYGIVCSIIPNPNGTYTVNRLSKSPAGDIVVSNAVQSFVTIVIATVDTTHKVCANDEYFYDSDDNIVYKAVNGEWQTFASDVSTSAPSTLVAYAAWVVNSILYYVDNITNTVYPAEKQMINISESSIIFKDSYTQYYIVYDFNSNKGYIVDLDPKEVKDNFIQVIRKIDNLYFDATELAYLTTETGVTVNEAFMKSSMYPYTDIKIEHIRDENLVNKTILKVYLQLEDSVYDFYLALYYREKASTDYGYEFLANTLVFEVIQTNTHTTYDANARNLACDKSIVPSVMQNVYTTDNRPDGFVNSVGQIYVTDGSDYFINYVNPSNNTQFRFIPHFDLNPASYLLNDTTAKWAYRFDITSTNNTTDLSSQTVLRSAWRDYDTHDTIFTTAYDLASTMDYTNETMENRHIYGATKVISIFSAATEMEATPGVNDVGGSATDPYDAEEPLPSYFEQLTDQDLSAAFARQQAIKTQIANVNDATSLRVAIEEMSSLDIRFGVLDVKTNERTSDLCAATVFTSGNVRIDSNLTDIGNYRLTASALLDLIDEGDFNNVNVVFKIYDFELFANYYYYSTGTGGGLYHTIYHSYFTIDFLVAEGATSFTQRLPWSTLTEPFKTYYRTPTKVAYNMFLDNNETFYTNNLLQFDTNTNSLVTFLQSRKFFQNGYAITFYLQPFIPADVEAISSIADEDLTKVAWDNTKLFQNKQVLFGYDDLTVTKIKRRLTEGPYNIKNAHGYMKYNDSQLVVWYKNIMYMSEVGQHNYFPESLKKEFSETIVKILQYKEILLVFTVQHLYAVYQVSETTTNEDGSVTTTNTYWASSRVLYNILVDSRYADAIQVFNDYILFYSSDGQMYLIKPSTMIDSETRFSLKFFNKAANDILQNYDQYINERLQAYNIDDRFSKEDKYDDGSYKIQIKVDVSINFIKIYYFIKDYITYILVYDVVNNRYYSQDSTTFNNVRESMYVESGQILVTQFNNSMYLSFPYKQINTKDNNVDMTVVDNFRKQPIVSLLDTGDLNLNNHLHKRFRDLEVVFKNLDASAVLYNVETELDNIISHPYYNTELKVQDIGGTSYYVTVPKYNDNDLIQLVDVNQISETATDAIKYALTNNLFEESNILMDFTNYTSSKLLSHKSSILGMGKVFRLKLQFVSKGSYKIQRFGIVYKERRI